MIEEKIMISKDFYKDRPAIKLSDDKAEVLFLPEDGAKLVSFKTKKGKELFIHTPSENYKRLFLDSEYIDCECSAFDDMFPTIDPCSINGIEYLDHGEVCRREHSCVIEDDNVKFECYLPKLNITYFKTASIEDGTLCVKYKIKNHNNFEFPYLWAAHMMFISEDGAKVESVFQDTSDIRVMFGNPPAHDVINEYRLDGHKKNYKYYHNQAKSPMKCGIVYPKSNLRVSVEFDGDIVKYFGVWMNIGVLNGLYNIALEPCTAPYDSPVNAKAENAESVLKANETIEFTMKIKYDELK